MARPKKAKTAAKTRGRSQRGQKSFTSSQPAAALFSLRNLASSSESLSKPSQARVPFRQAPRIGFVQSTDPDGARLRSTFEQGEERQNISNLSMNYDGASDQVITASNDLLRASSNGNEPGLGRSSSPTPSDSSQDVVVFPGRNLSKPLNSTEFDQKDDVKAAESSKQQSLHKQLDKSDFIEKSSVNPAPPSLKTQQRKLKGKGNSVHYKEMTHARELDSCNELSKHEISNESLNEIKYPSGSDRGLDDYLSNMREYKMISPTKGDFLGETEPLNENEWRSSDLEDFGDISTSDDVLDAVQQILSKRIRPSGLQYLVVWEGQTTDDARWILHSSLKMAGAAELIESFEKSEKFVPEYAEDESSPKGLDSDAYVDDLEIEDDESEDYKDEEDLIKRRVRRLTDERIAQLLAKQEELGLGSDEILLFDGEDEEASDDDLKIEDSKRALRRTKRRNQRQMLRPRSNAYLTKELEGDDYGEFDVMDFERPSLAQAAKRGKSPIPLDLGDSDLEESLRASWAADRKKKKAQKQQREELRAEGLLGKKTKSKAEPNNQYSPGILTMEDLRERLQQFLMGTDENLALPPMEKGERKAVHEIARSFGLKSSSTGKERARFPVLYKTSRTTEFDNELFLRICKKFARRMMPNIQQNGKVGGANARKHGGFAKVGYHDGEVVGASAPEIPSSNRGRAMLEKMGWSTGTALGSLDNNNQGILQPLTHVVKKSRAGLG